MSVDHLIKLAHGDVAEFAVSADVLLEASHGLKSQMRLFGLLLAIARRQELDFPVHFIRSLSKTYEQAHFEIQFALRQLLKSEKEFFNGDLGDAKAALEVAHPALKRIDLPEEAREMAEQIGVLNAGVSHGGKDTE